MVCSSYSGQPSSAGAAHGRPISDGGRELNAFSVAADAHRSLNSGEVSKIPD